ncbi:30S ribosomal protein S7, partial [Candidatus Shapirobacteria bacterium CG09_land_8_20_14_0_10_47_13]
MPRSKEIKKRITAIDPVFQSLVVNKLINRIMQDGKKSVAQKQVYEALKLVEEKAKTSALEVFQQALENIKPPLEVRSRRVGGAAYQVPA